MKVAPVSGDMLVKVALGAIVLGAAYYVVKAAKGQVATAAAAAAEWASNVASTTLNPASDQNAIYKPITSAVTAATGQDNSLGTWLRGFTSNDDARVQAMLNGTSTGGATGSY